jgi:putative transposase
MAPRKDESIRPKTPLCLEEAKRIVADFIEHHNSTRLHSSIGYIAPLARLGQASQNDLCRSRQKA